MRAREEKPQGTRKSCFQIGKALQKVQAHGSTGKEMFVINLSFRADLFIAKPLGRGKKRKGWGAADLFERPRAGQCRVHNGEKNDLKKNSS